jgi:hypothetical protein
VTSHAEARESLRGAPGSASVVRRSYDRAVVFECPCGCDEVLVINLDPRAGPSWRHRLDTAGLTLMPSVWRTSGCESHFIVWRSRIWWCGLESHDDEANDWPDEMDGELRAEWWRILREARARRG